MFEKIVHRIKKIVAFFEKANLNSPIQEPAILRGGGGGGGGLGGGGGRGGGKRRRYLWLFNLFCPKLQYLS